MMNCNHTWVDEFYNPVVTGKRVLDSRTEMVCMWCLDTLDWLDDIEYRDLDTIKLWRQPWQVRMSKA
jgi:hypothetical protein